jgi:hypothetical protein
MYEQKEFIRNAHQAIDGQVCGDSIGPVISIPNNKDGKSYCEKLRNSFKK